MFRFTKLPHSIFALCKSFHEFAWQKAKNQLEQTLSLSLYQGTHGQTMQDKDRATRSSVQGELALHGLEVYNKVPFHAIKSEIFQTFNSGAFCSGASDYKTEHSGVCDLWAEMRICL